jgi:hypothetical protein
VVVVADNFCGDVCVEASLGETFTFKVKVKFDFKLTLTLTLTRVVLR